MPFAIRPYRRSVQCFLKIGQRLTKGLPQGQTIQAELFANIKYTYLYLPRSSVGGTCHS
jgi:hypothetical protein